MYILDVRIYNTFEKKPSRVASQSVGVAGGEARVVLVRAVCSDVPFASFCMIVFQNHPILTSGEGFFDRFFLHFLNSSLTY